MFSRKIPKHVMEFFNLGNELNKHQDPVKFKQGLGAIQSRAKKEGDKKGVTFIKKQKKLCRF